MRPVFRTIRRGVAAAELAVCLPTVALLVFAAIEGANMVYLSHSLTVAAYEGARVAIRPHSTSQDAVRQCTEVIPMEAWLTVQCRSTLHTRTPWTEERRLQ